MKLSRSDLPQCAVPLPGSGASTARSRSTSRTAKLIQMTARTMAKTIAAATTQGHL